jgi:hypothetical protein
MPLTLTHRHNLQGEINMKKNINNSSDHKPEPGPELSVTCFAPENGALPEEIRQEFAADLPSHFNNSELCQIVRAGKDIFALLGWARAGSPSCDRDHQIGWHPCRRAERISLIATNTFLVIRPGSLRDKTGTLALRKALEVLPDNFEQLVGSRPLIAETRLPLRSVLTRYYRADGWTQCSDRHPDFYPTTWIRELIPDARNMLRRRYLDGTNTGDPMNPTFGLLPIPNEHLKSLKEALDRVKDPRARSRYPLGSVLALYFMALICGCSNFRQMAAFGKRLSPEQTELLNLPCRKKNTPRMTPGYSLFFALLPELDLVEVVNILEHWLKTHLSELPAVLAPTEPLIHDAFVSMVENFIYFSDPTEKARREIKRRKRMDPETVSL